ncbi:siderophore-interacting protein [Pleomorphomonas sp. PLEO]|uniref:siderophore-interacting protein n=1 Tax=Pleomorphomonas sp. PLEO TaxID=3239306 RepID=UPI00351E0C7C
MRPDFFANANRLDAIRRANCRRRVSVVEAFDLTPHMRRMIFEDLEPAPSEQEKPADWIKLHVPVLGDGTKHGRAYTVRERSGGKLVIDMALHGGLCASWARRARPGDQAEISGPRKGLKLTWPSDEVLLGADETGLPAVACILANLPRHTRGSVCLEVPDESDIQPIEAPPAIAVGFLPRKTAPPGRLLTQAMREARVSRATAVWVAAERATALELREHFEAMLPRRKVQTSGYWRMPCDETAKRHRFL